MHADVKYFLLLWLTADILVQADDFVYEYYVNKGVTRVTIFSCDQIQNDFRFVRRMNGLGISVSVTHPKLQFYNISNVLSRKDAWASGLFLDTRCHTREVNEKIIAQASEYRLYEAIHLWLILSPSLEEITKLLNDTSYSIMTDLAVGVETKIGYDLYDIYNPCKIRGGTLNVTQLGFWNFHTGLKITLTSPKVVRRSNLFGLVIKVSSILMYKPPEMTIESYLQDYTTKWQDPMSKYGYGMLRAIADLSNFTLEVQGARQWLVIINGTEEGMMPTVANGEVDIAGTPAAADRFIKDPRLHLLMSSWRYRSFFLLRSNEEKLKWTQLFTPFAIDSWCASVATGILFIMVVTMIQMTEFGHGWFVETGHAIFAVLGATCQQGDSFRKINRYPRHAMVCTVQEINYSLYCQLSSGPARRKSWHIALIKAQRNILLPLPRAQLGIDRRSERQFAFSTADFGLKTAFSAIFVTDGGLTFVPNRPSGRIAFLFLLLLGVLQSNYYGASVVSVRLSQPPEKMNDSLYSLAMSHTPVASEDYRSIDWSLELRSMIEWEVRYFKEKVWDKLPLSRYVDPEIGLANAAEGGYAYHTTPEVAYPYVESHWDDNAICDMTEVHVILPRVLTFFERSDSPFNKILKMGFIKIQNMGIQMRTIQRWKARTPFCSPDARSVQSVTFFEIAPALLMISIGIAVALTILCFEITVYKSHSPVRRIKGPRKKPRIIGKSTLPRA